jgi:hypothetical protein
LERADPSPDVDRSLLCAWNLTGLLQSGLVMLEGRAGIVMAGELGGLVALWTTLEDFEHGAPRTLVWVAWSGLLISSGLVAEALVPRRLDRFAAAVLPDEALAARGTLDLQEESRILTTVGASLAAHTIRLGRRLQVSVSLSLLALGLTAIAYVIEKT